MMTCLYKMSCSCNRRIKERNAKLATMNYKSCTTAAAAVESREQRRFRMPKYTTAASNSGTVTTQINWNPGPSCCCLRRWNCKVGGELKRVKMKETFYSDSVLKPAAGDKTEIESAERHDKQQHGAYSPERFNRASGCTK